MDSNEAALLAVAGDPDHVDTFLALIVAINGTLNRIEEAVAALEQDGYTPEDTVIQVARAFDGLDGHHDIAHLRAALNVLLTRAEALNA